MGGLDLSRYCFFCCFDGLLAADQPAEVTAHASASVKRRPSGFRIEFYRLMASVSAGDVASSAAVTELVDENGEEDCISLDALVIHHGVGCSAYQVP